MTINLSQYDNTSEAVNTTSDLLVSYDQQAVQFAVFTIPSHSSIDELLNGFWGTMKTMHPGLDNYPEWTLGLDEDIFHRLQNTAIVWGENHNITTASGKYLVAWQETLASYCMLRQSAHFGTYMWSRTLSPSDYFNSIMNDPMTTKMFTGNGILPVAQNFNHTRQVLNINDEVAQQVTDSIAIIVPYMLAVYHQ